MKNRLYNSVILSGLLSSSLALLGMEQQPGTQLTTPLTTSSTTPQASPKSTHHKSILQGIGDVAHNILPHHHAHPSASTASTSIPTTSTTSTTNPTLSAPTTPTKHRSRSSSKSSITPAPFDPNNPLAKGPEQSETHHHNLGEELKKMKHGAKKIGHEIGVEAEKAEKFIHEYGDIVLDDIIKDPALIIEILTAAGMNQETAQAITSAIEAGASKGKIVIDDIDTMLQQEKTAQAQKKADKLAKKQTATPKRETTPVKESFVQELIKEGEDIVINPIIGMLNFISDNPDAAAFALNELFGTTNGPIAFAELQKFQQFIKTLNQQSAQQTNTNATSTSTNVQPAANSYSYKSIIGGTIGVGSLIALLMAMLHRYDILENNIGEFLNNLIPSKLAA